MKRHSTLIKLSQEHHHTLALCLRILRQPENNYREEIVAHFVDLETHFCAEETQFAPLWTILNRTDLQTRFEQEHAQLRRLFQAAQFDSAQWNTTFATLLRDHARFEERELFPALQEKVLPVE
ncbi:hemerythrin domain-containing protein [Wielerella bovis]|uniref:hemerythrin domain-containing protein n=1 Tax=Wielerella bovis TaxID=2917790 RepID=UPI002018BD91|nr:hemerythrin domain-containing protein [Wielerella bovis]MCG7657222.1 hemerythrin domain-containing protein [Wielerella bovis]MCG7659444.1 hemerythrin domain-containing protein [Wielerella bovis]ULJ59335.1 hemerythrin domain-containing protein [Wielerella bovis]ULJ65742.1 hemerythrin domain-containing protein [Wielerella bovis]ULJ66151.1 hemerythrin domain-containing protein [Wielerella bovis]